MSCSQMLDSIRVAARNTPHSVKIPAKNGGVVCVSFLPPSIGPIGDAHNHYAIIVANDTQTTPNAAHNG